MSYTLAAASVLAGSGNTVAMKRMANALPEHMFFVTVLATFVLVSICVHTHTHNDTYSYPYNIYYIATCAVVTELFMLGHLMTCTDPPAFLRVC